MTSVRRLTAILAAAVAGYSRLMGAIRVYRVRDATAAKSPSAPASPALPLADKPSIAVMPFANMSGDPEQEYFADGMVEEIITALSRKSGGSSSSRATAPSPIR